MKQFEFEKTLSSRGQEMVEAYKTYMNDATPAFVKTAIKDAFRNERNCTINNAISNKVSVAEFDKLLRTSQDTAKYLTGENEEKDAAIAFMASVLPADAKVSFARGGKHTVIIEKRIGMKLSSFMDYFGTENRALFDTFGFTFVDTRIRKRINDVLPIKNPEHISIEVSKVYQEAKRNLINIAVDFHIPVSKLTDSICEEVMKIVRELDKVETEFL